MKNKKNHIKMKKYTLIPIFILLIVGIVEGQQYTVFSGYVNNHYFINPGAVGSVEGIRVGMGYKDSWTGFHNSPKMNIFSADAKINNEMGAGGKIFNYSTGPLSRLGFEGSYSYSFTLGRGKLSLGLSAILYQLHLDKSSIDMKNPDDEVLFRTTTTKEMYPDAAFGVYYYGDKYFAGLSAVQLFGRKADMMNDLLEFRQVRHYYLMGGYKFEFNEDFALEPSILLRVNETLAYQGDLNLKFYIKQLAYVGLSYRGNHNDFAYSPGDAVVGMLGIDMGNLIVGYAYDYLLNDIGNYSNGSHELMLVVKIGNGSGTAKL